MRILAVGTGASTHVATRTQWFAKRGHKVFLLTTAPHRPELDGVVQLVVPTDRLASHAWLKRWPAVLRPGISHALGVLAFVRAFRESRPDVVHIHYAEQYYGWIAGMLGSRPLVVTPMGSDVAAFEERAEPTTPEEWWTLRLLQAADYITPPSNFLVDVINRLGDFQGKTERIIWGVSPERFRDRDGADLRRALGIAPGARVILSPKALRPFYRVHLIVEAMAVVRRFFPDAMLVMSEYAADPEYRDQIVRRSDELGLGDSIRFGGELSDDDMPDLYGMADVSVAIPPRDGMPVALLEAMASGTPTILSRLPRYEEIVRHEESTYFVEPQPEALAAGIVRLLEDAQLCGRIADQGLRIVAEQADLDQQAAIVESRYRALTAETPPRAVRVPALLSSVLAAGRAYPTLRRPHRST
ncbi:MAG TPA: glycosyltransferase family 4 protein [Gaiellaceae bacterium]|nr:glycosyltransferase family 4 protein [Gaiellaceae bacterium]